MRRSTDWVVTPRRGKPVEIQALWYNALKLMAAWGEELGVEHRSYAAHANRARETFNERFWNARSGCLYDVIDGPNGDDASIRPNQVFAISLPHPILYERYWEPVIDTVRNRLLTAYGLRTLSAEHPDYKAHYRGDLRSRDAAYHQGTVWPWLIGPYIDAYLRVHPDRLGARQLLRAFPNISTKPASAASAKSSTPRIPTPPAAASRKRGASPKSCAPGCAPASGRCRGKKAAHNSALQHLVMLCC
jgi:glycogen debranching enzyme